MGRPRLIPTSCTDMVLVRPDTMDMDSDTMADSDTTARGLLMLRPIPTFFMEDLVTPDTLDTMAMDSDTPFTARGLLMLRLILTTTVLDTDLDTLDTLDTDTEYMARGLLMLSLKPRLILTTLDTPDLDTDTADTSTANRLHQDLSVNHRLDF